MRITFRPSGGRGGSGAGIIEHVFSNAAARDAFFAVEANRLTLEQGRTTILLADNGSGNSIVQLWNGATAPASYDNTNWLDVTSTTPNAATIKTLYESNADTNALTDALLAILNNFVIESDTLIRSIRSIEVPPGTIFIGEGTALGAAIRAVHVRSDITGNKGLVLIQLYDETTGFSRAFAYGSQTPDSLDLNDPAGTDTADDAVFTMQTSSDELITALAIATNRPSETIAFTVAIRRGSSTGPIAVNFAGDITTDAQGVGMLDLANTLNPILEDQSVTLHVTVSCDGMLGVDEGGGVFRPNATVFRIQISREELAYMSDLPTPRTDTEIFTKFADSLRVGAGLALVRDNTAETVTINVMGQSTPSVSNFTINIPSTVDVNTNLNTDHTVSYRTSGGGTISSAVLVVTGGDDISLNTPSGDGLHTQTVTLTGTSTTSPGTIQFAVRVTYDDGTIITSNMITVTIRAQLPQELAYYGTRATNDFATVDLSTLTSVDVAPPGTQFEIRTALANNHFLGILMPTDRNLINIQELTFNVPVPFDGTGGGFTATANAREIGGTQYILYTHQNQSGFDGNVDFRIDT